MLLGTGREGDEKWLFNGYRASFWGDQHILELDRIKDAQCYYVIKWEEVIKKEDYVPNKTTI